MEPITSTSARTLTPAVISDLRSQLEGTILMPEDDLYEETRKIWNGMIDKRPALIVQPQNRKDVCAAVKFGRMHELSIAIRGGGHNVAGYAVCDGGMMIDMANMKKVQVDPEQMMARAETGATWGDFDKATHVFGLATTGGLISTTGIAGLTLGGGVGWLVRKYGLSCDNLLEAKVVNAEGELLTASAKENSDLFWALRGGGGNFGVVTSLTYRLHPVSTVVGGMVLYPMTAAKEVLNFYREYIHMAPDELTLYACLVHTPDGIPAIALAGCCCGDTTAAEEAWKPVRNFGMPMADLVQQLPYPELQTMLDAGFPHGNRYYWKSTFLQTLSDDAIDTVVDYARQVTSPRSSIVLEFYGGAASHEPAEGTAYPHREEQIDLMIISNWADRSEDERHIAWTRNFYNDMQPCSSHRVYVNALGIEGDQRVREAYGEHFDRLLAVKRKYDPRNIFHMNQNINPAE